MDIIEQAIAFELEGHKFYLKKTEAAKDSAVKAILTNLADDELKHAQFLRELKAGTAKTFAPTNSMHTIREILKKTAVNNLNFLSDEIGIRDVCNAALDLEERAMNHYSAEAIQTQNPETQELLKLLAKEEEKHYHLIQDLIDFIDNPKAILETQEFQWYDV